MELPLSAMPNRITVIHKTWLPHPRQPSYFSIFTFPTLYSFGMLSPPAYISSTTSGSSSSSDSSYFESIVD